MRSRLRRPAPLLLVAVAAALVLALVAGWAVLRPAAVERGPLPDPIRITDVPASGPPAPASTEPPAPPSVPPAPG
ncbi:tonB-system energizer ExbB, partial [Geodermatophilus sp. DF01-2]